MAISVVMPALEMAQETGKLVSWKKKDGETVKKGELLLEVETDKAVVEIEAAGDGILGGITAQAGDVVPVGQTIAWLLKAGEAPPATTRADADGTDRRRGAAGGRVCAAPLLQRRPVGAAPVPSRFRRRRAVSRKSTASTSRESRAPAPAARSSRKTCSRRKDRSAAAPAARGRPAAAPAAAQPAVRRTGCAQLHRPDHGRADDAELDDGAALLRVARGGLHRAGRCPQAVGARDRADPRRQADVHGPADRDRGADAAQAPADERELDGRCDQGQRRRQRRPGDGRHRRGRCRRRAEDRRRSTSATSRRAAATSPSARARTSCRRPTSRGRPSPSAISGCTTWIRSRRSSCRRRRAFSPSAR